MNWECCVQQAGRRLHQTSFRVLLLSFWFLFIKESRAEKSRAGQGTPGTPSLWLTVSRQQQSEQEDRREAGTRQLSFDSVASRYHHSPPGYYNILAPSSSSFSKVPAYTYVPPSCSFLEFLFHFIPFYFVCYIKPTDTQKVGTNHLNVAQQHQGASLHVPFSIPNCLVDKILPSSSSATTT